MWRTLAQDPPHNVQDLIASIKKMIGFDLSRPPHPKALALLSPLVSGVVLIAGIAYYRSDLTAKFLAYSNLNLVTKMVLALVLGYAVGLLLSMAVSPFGILVYLFGYGLGLLAVRKTGEPLDPSLNPSIRRGAEVVLGL